MYKLIRFYNQNRSQIIKVIIIIAFIIGFIKLLNYLVKNQNGSSQEININTSSSTVSNSVISNKSAITNSKIETSKLKSDTDVIEDFMKYCNNKDIGNAYNLITEECKEEMYPTEEDFYQNYYMNIFNEQKLYYSIENWIDETYSVKIMEDLLTTGKINKNTAKQDYITVVKKENEYKLNINNYIGRENSNKITDIKNIKTKVIEKNIYMDYVIYTLEIENNTGKTILLDTKERTDTIYLQNDKGSKIFSASNEIVDDRLIIDNNYTNKIKIKFNSTYSSNKLITFIMFSDVILDYNDYLEQEDKENYENRFSLQIDL